MIGLDEVLAALGHARRDEVTAWIERRWVRPIPAPAGYMFTEIDVARCRLILEMRDELAIDEEVIPVVLSLLDQVYDLRRQLRQLASALAAQPEEIRQAIRAELERREAE